MTPDSVDSIPEISDRHQRLFAFALLTVGVAYAARAGAHFADGGSAAALEWSAFGLRVAAVALILPIIVWNVRALPNPQRNLHFSADAFASSAWSRAVKMSWVVTFVLLTFVAEVSGPELPTAFLLELVTAVTATVTAGTFLYLYWMPAEDLDDLPHA